MRPRQLSQSPFTTSWEFAAGSRSPSSDLERKQSDFERYGTAAVFRGNACLLLKKRRVLASNVQGWKNEWRVLVMVMVRRRRPTGANPEAHTKTHKYTQNSNIEHMQGTTHRGQCLEEIGCRDKLSGRGRIE